MRLGVLGAAVLCCFAMTADAQAAPRCLTSGTTLVASRTARIYKIERSFRYHTVATWLACDIQSGRRHVLAMGGLGENDQTKGIFEPALNGRFVAYQAGIEAPGYGCMGDLVVFDIRRGRVLRTAPFGGGSVCAQKIVVTRGGSAAVSWTQEFGDAGIAALDSPHGLRVLDHVTDYSVDANSLALAGPNTVTWQHGEETRTARLR